MWHRTRWCPLLAGTLLALLAGTCVGAELLPVWERSLARIAETAGVPAASLVPDLLGVQPASPTRARQLPLYRELMAEPLTLPERMVRLESTLRRDLHDPQRLLEQAVALAGVPLSSTQHLAARDAAESRLRRARDPLALGLRLMTERAGSRASGTASLPPATGPDAPLRLAVGRLLASIGEAERLRRRALAKLPHDSGAMLRQLLDPDAALTPQTDYRRLLPLVDRAALFEGMLQLAGAVQALQAELTQASSVPAVAWDWQTPLGRVIVDTTGASTERRLHDTLLVVDVGGDDTYVFETRAPAQRIAVVLDIGGNDRYLAQGAGADPSAAVLGYGVLWDSGGDDRYEGADFAQATAFFGAALLVDDTGRNVFQARAFAQGFALAGVALLVGGEGADWFTAGTHAQGSAAAEGVALLVDRGGDDRYALENAPLLWPSSQLPERNVSMGQGAGRGERARVGARGTTGGIGVLFDAAGDDRYSAQVFAQGVGYHEGVGWLIDGGGEDVFEAAWYAMGAAAHTGVGGLLKRGEGHDRYHASHSTSLGAAHDRALAFFGDEGGDDSYRLGGLGLGAAHDHSLALFLDAGGDDSYMVEAPICNALGVALVSDPDPGRVTWAGTGLFADAAGSDKYISACTAPRNDAHWRGLAAGAAAAGAPQRGLSLDWQAAP